MSLKASAKLSLLFATWPCGFLPCFLGLGRATLFLRWRPPKRFQLDYLDPYAIGWSWWCTPSAKVSMKNRQGIQNTGFWCSPGAKLDYRRLMSFSCSTFTRLPRIHGGIIIIGLRCIAWL
jgi:hypothetical protein